MWLNILTNTQLVTPLLGVRNVKSCNMNETYHFKVVFLYVTVQDIGCVFTILHMLICVNMDLSVNSHTSWTPSWSS